MDMGPTASSGAASVIVEPSRLGSNTMAPPAEPSWLAAQRIEPESRPPLVFVTVTWTSSPVATPEAFGFATGGTLGSSGSSAHAESAALAATENASGHRRARRATMDIGRILD